MKHCGCALDGAGTNWIIRLVFVAILLAWDGLYLIKVKTFGDAIIMELEIELQ